MGLLGLEYKFSEEHVTPPHLKSKWQTFFLDPLPCTYISNIKHKVKKLQYNLRNNKRQE